MILETLPAVQQLPIEDKIRLWEELWRDLIAHQVQVADLHDRLTQLEQLQAQLPGSPDAAQSWDDVKRRLEGADWYH